MPSYFITTSSICQQENENNFKKFFGCVWQWIPHNFTGDRDGILGRDMLYLFADIFLRDITGKIQHLHVEEYTV
jgi:hypothetical protein